MLEFHKTFRRRFMYPIVFNLNESYVPYASVLMTSIIQNTNKDSNVAGGGGLIIFIPKGILLAKKKKKNLKT